jgi:hypothetical protein
MATTSAHRPASARDERRMRRYRGHSSGANALRAFRSQGGRRKEHPPQLTNQSFPDATVRGADHPLDVRSAKRSVARWPSRSTQLRIRPRGEADSCGWPLFGPAGEMTVSTAGDHAGTERSCVVAVTIVAANSKQPTPKQPCLMRAMISHSPTRLLDPESECAAARVPIG